jgi:hypothetical protein
MRDLHEIEGWRLPILPEGTPGSNSFVPEILCTAVLRQVTMRAIMRTKEPLNGIQGLHVATLSRRER